MVKLVKVARIFEIPYKFIIFYQTFFSPAIWPALRLGKPQNDSLRMAQQRFIYKLKKRHRYNLFP